MGKHKDVPYIVFESSEAKSERTIKRLIYVIILLISLLFITNICWLYNWSTYDTYSLDQDGVGINNVNTGSHGDLDNEPESTNAIEEKQKFC